MSQTSTKFPEVALHLPEFAVRQHATRKVLFALASTAAPIAAVGLMNMAISVTDMAMMAHLDRDALAAGAIVSDAYSIIFQFSAGTLSAVTPYVARASASYGSDRVGEVVGQGVRLAFLIGMCGFLLVYLSPVMLARLGVNLPLPEVAATYAHYMAGAFGLMLIVALGRSVFPAVGKGLVPFIVMAGAVPLNAMANTIFMYGWFGAPRMGLAGAGAASLIVAAACAGTLIAYAILAPAMRHFRFASGIASASHFIAPGLVRVGLVTGAASLCETGVFLSSTILVGLFATDSVPAHVAVFRSVALTYVILSGYGQAVTIHIARASTASSAAHQAAVQNAAIKGGIVLWATFLAGLWLLPWIASIFGEGDSGIRILAPWVAIAASSLVPAAIAFAILRARLDISTPTAISFFGYWAVGFDLMLILAGGCGFGARGIWMGLAIGATTTAAGSWLYLTFVEEFHRFLDRARCGAALEIGRS